MPGQAPQAIMSIPELGILAERIRTFEVRLAEVEQQLAMLADYMRQAVGMMEVLQSGGIGGLMKLMKGSE